MENQASLWGTKHFKDRKQRLCYCLKEIEGAFAGKYTQLKSRRDTPAGKALARKDLKYKCVCGEGGGCEVQTVKWKNSGNLFLNDL